MKNRKRFLAVILVVAAVLTMFTACNKKNDKDQLRTADADGLFHIKINVQTVFNEFYVADLLGFYKDEGIAIDWIGRVEGLGVYQLLEQGTVDVADGHPNQVAQARLAGMHIKAVVPGMVDHPDYPHVRYFARENGPIKSLDDIVGKKVGITGYASCIDGYLRHYLTQKGIPGEVEWTVLSAGGQAEQALTQGLIDLTTSHPPFGSLAATAGGNWQVATSWDVLESSGAGLSVRSFTEDFITKYPDVIRGFARAMYKARRWINENMEEAVPLVSKALGLDPEKVDYKWDGRWYEENAGFQRKDIDTWFEICEELGYWKHGEIYPQDIYTNEFDPAPVVSSVN